MKMFNKTVSNLERQVKREVLSLPQTEQDRVNVETVISVVSLTPNQTAWIDNDSIDRIKPGVRKNTEDLLRVPLSQNWRVVGKQLMTATPLNPSRNCDSLYWVQQVLEQVQQVLVLLRACHLDTFSFDRLLHASSELSHFEGFARYPEKSLADWAKTLELLGERLEDSLAFLTFEVADNLYNFCTKVVLEARNKDKNYNSIRNEYRRRIRFAAGFILNLLEMAEDDAIAEEEEARQHFLLASESVFQDVWG